MSQESSSARFTLLPLALPLLLLLLLVGLPRFNREDLGLVHLQGHQGAPGDQVRYIDMVLHFRGQPTEHALKAPFVYRPLVPFLASWLPLRADTAINVLNLAALAGALLLLLGLLRRLGLGRPATFLGGLLFVASFPVFYYGTIGYLDPVMVFVLTLGLRFILAGQWLALLGTLASGLFVKESALLLLPVVAVALALDRSAPRQRLGWFLASLVVAVVGLSAARLPLPVSEPHGWLPESAWLRVNLARPRCWLSLLLSLGLPGALAIHAMIQQTRSPVPPLLPQRSLWPLVSGLLGALALACYSLVSAYTDGRFIWLACPFSIPLAAAWLDQRLPKTR
jgi:hypothetical protein